MTSTQKDPLYERWRWQIFAITWLAYAGFYLTRKSFAVAKIGIQKDSTHADWADKSFRRSAQLKRYNTTAEALDALTKNEVDAVFGDKAQLWLWSQKPEGKCCEIVGQDIKDNQTLGLGVAAGLRKEDAKLRDALNKAFGEMMSDGTYKKINDKYFPFPLN